MSSALTAPVIQFADRYFVQRDQYRSVITLCDEWDALVSQLASMAPNDPAAPAAIEEGFRIKDALRYILGPRAQWDAASHGLLHRESRRLTGEGKPNPTQPDAALTTSRIPFGIRSRWK